MRYSHISERIVKLIPAAVAVWGLIKVLIVILIQCDSALRLIGLTLRDDTYCRQPIVVLKERQGSLSQ